MSLNAVEKLSPLKLFDCQYEDHRNFAEWGRMKKLATYTQPVLGQWYLPVYSEK